MNLRASTFWLIASLLMLTSIRAEDSVELSRSEELVAVTINGKAFTTFRFAKELPKPYFFPVQADDGAMLTRPLVGPDYQSDHPHHKGIWVAVDEVNSIKFWAEQGKIENRGVELKTAKGNPAIMQVTNHWVDKQGADVIIEATTIRIFADRMLTYDITLKMASADVNFRDTKEGFFGFRLAESQREDNGDGKVLNADGKQGTKDCWGQRSAWVDYTGSVDGKLNGVTIFDHPGNFRPGRYHVRNYGLFSISPFGEAAYTNNVEAPVNDVFKKDDSLRLRYAIYFHAGNAIAVQLNALAVRFTGIP